MLLTFFLSFEFSISEYLSFCSPFFLYSRRILADIEQNIEFRKDFTRGIRVNYVVSSFLSFSIALSMFLTFFRSQNMFLSKTLLIHAEYWPINRENKIGETSNPEADKEENFSLGKIKFSRLFRVEVFRFDANPRVESEGFVRRPRLRPLTRLASRLVPRRTVLSFIGVLPNPFSPNHNLRVVVRGTSYPPSLLSNPSREDRSGATQFRKNDPFLA